MNNSSKNKRETKYKACSMTHPRPVANGLRDHLVAKPGVVNESSSIAAVIYGEVDIKRLQHIGKL